MKVSLMPEYDDPSMLVIYDGRFAQAPGYPLKTSFLVPKGSLISDACSLSHEGQHFCQLFQTRSRGAFDEISLTLPFPNFYLAFHTPKLESASADKLIAFDLKASHAIKSLEIDIQQPLRSSGFAVTVPKKAQAPVDAPSTSIIRGFQHVLYRMEDIAFGEEARFSMRYEKSDPNPSVDLKYTSMRPQQIGSAPYDTQRRVKGVVYAIFGSAVVVALAALAWYLRARKKRTAKSP